MCDFILSILDGELKEDFKYVKNTMETRRKSLLKLQEKFPDLKDVIILHPQLIALRER